MGYKSPRTATLIFCGGGVSPADASTYYWGMGIDAPATAWQLHPIPAPVSGFIRKVVLFHWMGVSGTAEDCTVYVNLEGTDYLLGAIKLDADGHFVKDRLNIPIVCNEGPPPVVSNITIKIVFPTWVTNPENVRINGSILVEYA